MSLFDWGPAEKNKNGTKRGGVEEEGEKGWYEKLCVEENVGLRTATDRTHCNMRKTSVCGGCGGGGRKSVQVNHSTS